MTQEQRRKPSPYKRTSTKSERNRPVLISKELPTNNQPVEETILTPAESPTSEIRSESVAETTAAKPARRKLPNFFSTVGAGEQSQPENAREVRDARLARATKGKKIAASTEVEETPKPTAPASRTRQLPSSSRSGGTFKMRYIWGMVIYLLVAQFAGVYMTSYLKSAGLDRVLTTINLFGGNLVISISTVLFLVILVGLLFVLARFDLIPRSFAYSGGNNNRKTPSRSEPGERVAPPTIRTGVKGDHDSLYEQYRKRQRRDRKH